MKKSILALLTSCLLSFSLFVNAQGVTLRPLCDASFGRGGAGSVQMRGYLYTLSFYNNLHKTNLATGETSQLGKEMFTDVRFFFGVGNRLFIIRTDRSMIEIDINTGAFHTLLPANSWQFVSWVIPIGRDLYTVSEGNLSLNPGIRPQPSRVIGKPEFANLEMTLRTDSTLHTIMGNFLYKIDLRTGEWIQLKKDKALRNYRTGAVIGTHLYFADNKGALMDMDMGSGEIKLLDDKQFTNPVMLFQDLGKLYYLDNSYKLYEVVLGSPAAPAN